MRVLLFLFASLCAFAVLSPANALTAVSFTPTLPSLNPSGVLYYKDTLTVTSIWDAQPTLSNAQIRLVDPNGKQSIVSASTCTGTPATCTTNFGITATGNAALNADLNFTYLATTSASLVPRTWCFLVKGVCADASLATAPTSFSIVYTVALQAVTISSSNALPGVAVAGNTVSVKFTFNTPMISSSINCTINGVVTTKIVNRYDITCSRVVSSSDLSSAASKEITFWGNPSQFFSTGTVSCTQGLCAGGSLVTSTSDGSSLTMYAPMQATSVVMASNNVDASKATVGDTITVTFSFNQIVSTSTLPDCKINGFQATVVPSAKTYLCSRIVTQADLAGQSSASSTFALTSSSVRSEAGLGCTAGLCTSQTLSTPTAGSRVVMYTPFDLTAVSMASNNADFAKAQVGDTITLSLQFNQAVTSAGPTACTLLGHTVPAAVSGAVVTCSYTISSSDVSGPATFLVDSAAFTANGQACTGGLCSSPTVSSTTDGTAVAVSVCGGGANVGSYSLSSVSASKQACLSQCA